MADKYDCLKLENQLCFPLYVCAKEMVRKYRPHLDALNLTYTQYITLMVLWERGEMGVRELGDYLYLDSGTLTPLLKTLEKKGIIRRSRSEQDERSLLISLTDAGRALREKAVEVPAKMGACIRLDPQDAMELYQILHRMMDGWRTPEP